MLLNCEACHKTFEAAGDAANCVECGAEVSLPKAPTVPYEPGFRPETLRDDEVLPVGALLGQYRIDQFIGRGGMGAVYRATHTMLRRTVAIKVLPPKFAVDPEFVQRFKREALALANLSHPNIVAIHDMGVQGEIYYFVMEFVEGASLRDILVEKKLAPEEALKIVPLLCDAMEYAHSKGVIHRDIKPENIILARDGVPKIADFGLAKIVKGETAAASLTQTNVVMGTMEYMAPEQRDNMKTVDHRADIYSLGVVLYEMLTGGLPMGKFEPPSRRIAIDVRIDDVVLKALENEPDRRYQRASHMGTDVSQVRVTRVPSREVPILDLTAGKAIGTASNRSMAVRCGEASVHVSTWDRDEIGLRVEGGFSLLDRTLHARDDTESIDVFVPKGVELDIAGGDGDVTVTALSGALAVRLQDGAFSGSELEGRISIVGGDGDLSIAGLKGEDIEVRSGDGSISISRLAVTKGRTAIESGDGSIAVALAPEASVRYQVFTKEGEIAAPAGGAVSDRTAVGTIGGGGAALSIRSGDGDITLRAGGRPGFDAAVLRDVRASITPVQIEKLGKFVIVNAALWLFFVLVWGTIVPPVCVSVFWGMALALDIWKGYVRSRGGAEQAPKGPRVRVRVANPVVQNAYREPERPSTAVVSMEAPAPETRMSLLAVLAFLAGFPALMCVLGFTIVSIVGASMTGTADLADLDWYWATYACFTFASLLTGIVALGFGLAAMDHVREARGRLRGRGGAIAATMFGILAVVLFGMRGTRALDEAIVRASEVSVLARGMEGGFERGEAASFLPQEVPEEERKFVEALKRGVEVRLTKEVLAPDLERAEVHFRLDGSFFRVSLERREGRWKVLKSNSR
ncbi:MAG: protein kinase [Planctomycetes bacterium]|nr:protein kinase [Planctomycetota bacterium]